MLGANNGDNVGSTRPLYQSYSLNTQNIFAGEYPSDKDEAKAKQKIDQMVHFGRLFCPEGKRFEDTIELHNIILALADDLYTGCIISEYDPIDTPEKKQWYARYCKMEPMGI